MKTKIWAVCWWNETWDKNVAVRAARNWPLGDFFELDEENYEYLLVFGALNGESQHYLKNPEKTVGFMLEPEWSQNWQRDLPRYCKYVASQSKEMFPGFDNVLELPTFMFTESTDSYEFYQKNPFPKKRRMSLVSSSYGHQLNYIKRHKLFTSLLNTDLDIDFFGRGWNISDPRYKGAPYNKSEALLDYEYSIGIENSNYDNYLTEKFFDLIVCNTVPIYYGCPNVKEIYPQESFIPLQLDGPVERTVEQITEIYNNDSYDDRLPHVLRAKDMYYNKYNAFRFLESLIKEGKI